MQEGSKDVTFNRENRSVLRAVCLEAYEMLEQLACDCARHGSSSRQLEAQEAWRRITAYMSKENGSND